MARPPARALRTEPPSGAPAVAAPGMKECAGSLYFRAVKVDLTKPECLRVVSHHIRVTQLATAALRPSERARSRKVKYPYSPRRATTRLGTSGVAIAWRWRLLALFQSAAPPLTLTLTFLKKCAHACPQRPRRPPCADPCGTERTTGARIACALRVPARVAPEPGRRRLGVRRSQRPFTSRDHHFHHPVRCRFVWVWA